MGGGSGTGLLGVLEPLKNKTISCTYGAAKVDSSGHPFVQFNGGANLFYTDGTATR